MKKTLKVLHISSALSWRGGEQQIVNLIDGLNLINDNIDQMIFCARKSAIEKYSISHQISFKSAKKNLRLMCFILQLYQELLKAISQTLFMFTIVMHIQHVFWHIYLYFQKSPLFYIEE